MLLLPATMLLVLALDQASKALVLRHVGGGPYPPVGSGPRIRRVLNVRIGMGLAPGGRVLLGLWGVLVLGMPILIYAAPALQGPAAQIGIAAALGGATGNLLDRLRHGAVVDFIDLRCWPVFNLADVAIVVGVAAVVLSWW